jgi:hypothetical protein
MKLKKEMEDEERWGGRECAETMYFPPVMKGQTVSSADTERRKDFGQNQGLVRFRWLISSAGVHLASRR